MKKLLTVFLIASMIYSLSGCKTQKEYQKQTESILSRPQSTHQDATPPDGNKEPGDAESTTAESTRSQPGASSSQTAKPSANGNSNRSVPSPAAPTGAACQHQYRGYETVTNCTAEGYIVYTCTKCGHTYQKVIPPQHDYGKYYCMKCGKIDPQSDPYWALNAWLSAYGEENGKGNMYCYPNELAAFQISSISDSNTIFISYTDPSSGIYFNLHFDSSDICQANFVKGRIFASFETEKSALSSAQDIMFTDFYCPEEISVDVVAFTAECAQLIDPCMLRAQNEILYPKTGLKLKDFGFTNYS